MVRSGKEVQIPKKRRSGASSSRQRETSPPPVVDEYPSRYFIDEDAHLRYDGRYAHRKVLKGRVIEVEFFRDFPIIDWFNIQGWTELLGRRYPIYPNLVKMFYANLEIEIFEGYEILMCYVNGTRFRMTAHEINEIFGIQSSATRPRNPISPLEAKADLLGEHAGVEHPQASHLDIPTRIVMLIVNWIVRPISGHLTNLTDVVAMIVYNIKHGIYADLGQIMVTHIGSMRHYHTANLPYGMWMTPIFEHFGVDLSDQLETKLMGANATIGERSLRSMGMEEVGRGQWRWKQVQHRGEPEREEDDPGNEQQYPHEPIREDVPMEHVGGASSSAGYPSYMARYDVLEQEIRAIRENQEQFSHSMYEHNAMVASRLTRIEDFNATVDSRLSSIDETMASMNDTWSSFNQFVQGYMAQHPDQFPPPSDN